VKKRLSKHLHIRGRVKQYKSGGREVGEMVEAFFAQWLKGAAGPDEKGKAVRTRSKAVN